MSFQLLSPFLKPRAMTGMLVTCLWAPRLRATHSRATHSRTTRLQTSHNGSAPQPLPLSLNLPNERTKMMHSWLKLSQGRTLAPLRDQALWQGLRRTRRCIHRALEFLRPRVCHGLYPQRHRRLGRKLRCKLCCELRSKLRDWRRLGLRLALSLGLVGLFLSTATPALAFFATFNTKVTQLTTDLAVLVRGCCVLWVVVEIALLIIGRGHMVRLLLPIAGSILLTILPAVKSYFGM